MSAARCPGFLPSNCSTPTWTCTPRWTASARSDITGTINPLSGTQTNEIKISVKDVDLTPASPYAGKFAGYRIARGKLNLDLDV